MGHTRLGAVPKTRKWNERAGPLPHAMRRFGLLAPSAQCVTSAALFALLGQKKRPRPQRLNWRNSPHKYFGVDPLVDSRGQSMHWARRLKPVAR
jgi:hypothetical protein